MGSLNRLGPALPGLKYSTPFFIWIDDLCEWPLITACIPAATGSMSSSFTSWRM